ncbi:MAG: hypothetical protein JWM99_1396 [Verrucomicrobiales bacterium]|nr:hypothetical protein [Verrucomicrobiales bacterium]
MKTVNTLFGFLLAGALGTIAIQYNLIQKHQSEVGTLNERLRTLEDEHNQNTARSGSDGLQNEQASRDRLELMRLRAEVSRLSQSIPKIDGVSPAQGQEVIAPRTGDAAIDRVFESLHRNPLPEEQAIITKVAAKEKDLKSWWEALEAYAQNHAGLTPNSISDLQSYLPAGFQGSIDVSGFTFEKGVALSSLNENQIIYKEPNPLALSDGVVCNVWLFANGRIDLFQ